MYRFDLQCSIWSNYYATLLHDDVVDESMERRGFFQYKCLMEKQGCCSCWRLPAISGDCYFRSITMNSNFFELWPSFSEGYGGGGIADREGRWLDIRKLPDIIRQKLFPSLQLPVAGSTSQAYQSRQAISIIWWKLVSPPDQDGLFDYGSKDAGKQAIGYRHQREEDDPSYLCAAEYWPFQQTSHHQSYQNHSKSRRPSGKSLNLVKPIRLVCNTLNKDAGILRFAISILRTLSTNDGHCLRKADRVCHPAGKLIVTQSPMKNFEGPCARLIYWPSIYL